MATNSKETNKLQSINVHSNYDCALRFYSILVSHSVFIHWRKLNEKAKILMTLYKVTNCIPHIEGGLHKISFIIRKCF